MADEDKVESTVSKTVTKMVNRAQQASKPVVAKFTSAQSGIALQKATNFVNLMNNSFAQSEKLYQNRLNTNQRIQQLNSDYVVATQDVLNDKTLSFLVDHSKINVPTFTSIVAGFELARASRADKLQQMVKGEQDMLRDDIKAEQDFVNQSTTYHDKLGQATNRYADDLIRVGETGFQATQSALRTDVAQANTIENKATDQQYSLDKMGVQINANTQARREEFGHQAKMENLRAANKNVLSNQSSTFPGDGGAPLGTQRLGDGTLVDSYTGEVVDENNPSVNDALGLSTTQGILTPQQVTSNIMRGGGTFDPNSLRVDGGTVVENTTNMRPQPSTQGGLGNRATMANQRKQAREETLIADYAKILKQGPTTRVTRGQGGRNNSRVIPTPGYEEALEYANRNNLTEEDIDIYSQQEGSTSFLESIGPALTDFGQPVQNSRLPNRNRQLDSDQDRGNDSNWVDPGINSIDDVLGTDPNSNPFEGGSFTSSNNQPTDYQNANVVAASQPNTDNTQQEQVVNIPVSQLVEMVNNPNVSVGPDGDIIANVPKEDDDDDNRMIVG